MLADLIIYQKTYDFLLWLYPVINKFPKSQRFVLGQRIENKALDILRLIIRANLERNKTSALKEMSVELDELRTKILRKSDFLRKNLIIYQF